MTDNCFLGRGAQGPNIPQPRGGGMFGIEFGHRCLGRNMRIVIVQCTVILCTLYDYTVFTVQLYSVHYTVYTAYTISLLHLC